MWRAEDIFFAALGGGNYGGPPITAPEQIADNVSANPASSLALAPLMHGNAQWTMSIALYGGNSVVLNTGRRFDARGDLGPRRARERVRDQPRR